MLLLVTPRTVSRVGTAPEIQMVNILAAICGHKNQNPSSALVFLLGGSMHLSGPLDGIVVPQPRADGVVSSPPWKCHFEQNFMICSIYSQ